MKSYPSAVKRLENSSGKNWVARCWGDGLHSRRRGKESTKDRKAEGAPDGGKKDLNLRRNIEVDPIPITTGRKGKSDDGKFLP